MKGSKRTKLLQSTRHLSCEGCRIRKCTSSPLPAAKLTQSFSTARCSFLSPKLSLAALADSLSSGSRTSPCSSCVLREEECIWSGGASPRSVPSPNSVGPRADPLERSRIPEDFDLERSQAEILRLRKQVAFLLEYTSQLEQKLGYEPAEYAPPTPDHESSPRSTSPLDDWSYAEFVRGRNCLPPASSSTYTVPTTFETPSFPSFAHLPLPSPSLPPSSHKPYEYTDSHASYAHPPQNPHHAVPYTPAQDPYAHDHRSLIFTRAVKAEEEDERWAAEMRPVWREELGRGGSRGS